MRESSISIIDWRQSQEGHLVAFENGQELDTLQDGAHFQFQSHKNQVVFIGLGSGFLLEQLAQKNPQLEIYVIESREALVSAKRKLYPQVHFIVIKSIYELVGHSEYPYLVSVNTEKILDKKSAGHQLPFFEEIFWHLNLRTSEALKKAVPLSKPIDDRWLINAKQMFESVEVENLPFKKSEALIIRELIK